MQKAYILIVVFLYTSGVWAQQCTDLYFMQGPKTVTMTIYDNRDKKMGSHIYTVIEVNNEGDSMVADMFIEAMDSKGRSGGTLKGKYICTGGIIKTDMKLSLPQLELTGKKSLKFTGDYLEYPLDMKVGDVLKNSYYTIVGGKGLLQYMHYEITYRTVAGRETITTPAGTWNCFRISYKGKVYLDEKKRKAVNVSGMEFYAPDFGVVKTESPQYYTMVTDIK